VLGRAALSRDVDAADAGWLLDDPEQALTALERLPAGCRRCAPWSGRAASRCACSRCRKARAVTAVRVSSGRDWFALDGELQLDERRVLSLQQLLQLLPQAAAAASSRSARASTWRSPTACASSWPTCDALAQRRRLAEAAHRRPPGWPTLQSGWA
jgi:hypothetical protein